MEHPADLAHATVLIVARSVDDGRQIRGLLAEEFGLVEVSTQAGEEIVDFERVKPQVLLLAYRELEQSERCYLGLLRKSRLAHTHPHRTILLCDATSVVTAFEMCKKGYFDDYVLYWPQSHDARRLAMSVWIALRELAASPAHGLGPLEMAAHAKRVNAMEDALAAQIKAGAEHASLIREAMEKTRIECVDAGATSQTLGALAASSAAAQPISDWAHRLGGEIAPHMSAVRELADKVKPVAPQLMVVEDDPFAAKLVVKALEGQAWRVVVASSAAGAMAQLRTIRPAVILMDVNLPDVDGVALTEQLKASPALAAIPVLMLTADSRRDILARSIKAGAAGFIVKPFTSAGLVAKLAPFLS
jgi:CheY-like chemotaxis protein